jgi:GNAT superfamily N-acetyltransferase
LIVRTLKTCYRGVYPEEAITCFTEYHSPDHILTDAGSGYTLVLEDETTIIGTGTLQGTNIRRFFIAPEDQGKGFGRQIASALENKALSGRIPDLDLESSLVAVEFWKKLGYKIEKEDIITVANGKKLNYYKMTKKLVKKQPT